ncbi:MAG TPA: adenine deaminase [Lacipirellulaceae bacterium]|nr:adenine deaminase [Lacipirellulaceae bacterium]
MSATPSGASPEPHAESVVVGRVVDVHARRIYPGRVRIGGGKISAIEPLPGDGAEGAAGPFLLPGFIDAHVHVESSMLVPTEFARAAVVHGAVATVSDPHEIGNVLGVAGVEYMLANAAQSPLKFYFGAPSCVPATTFETAGATISVAEVERLLDDPRIRYLSEMMNVPGVLGGDPDCLAKIRAAQARGKPVDGHAPGLRGEQARRYVAAGMSTDHECFTKEEALDKIAAGCKISIREGSAARNFDALYTLIGEHPRMTMLCSDDKHPDELETGHINLLVRRAVERGIDLFDVLQAACVNPVEHYGLTVGLLRPGDPADLIEVDSLATFNVLRTWIDGRVVAQGGAATWPRVEPAVVNHFAGAHVQAGELAVRCRPGEKLQVIEALEGQLITRRLPMAPKEVDGLAVSDPARDLLKIVVVNRYAKADAAVAFIKNFGLQTGAMASSVAHDSHTVIAVGATDDDLAAAVNAVMDARGGLAAVCRARGEQLLLPLPVAGLMATGSCAEVARAYQQLDAAVKSWGSPLRAPYMTLSFMALLVIPELKLSDLGLFDGGAFQLTPLLAP